MPWGPSDSAQTAFAITPSDTTLFPAIGTAAGVAITKAIYVGGTGDLVVRLVGTTTNITFASVPAGALLPITVERVMGTGSGTTATSILGLW